MQSQLSLLKDAPKLLTHPPTPQFSLPPKRELYALRDLYFWHPEALFGVQISQKLCSCNGVIVFKEFTRFRRVEEIEDHSYITAAVYKCRKCKRIYNTLNEEHMQK